MPGNSIPHQRSINQPSCIWGYNNQLRTRSTRKLQKNRSSPVLYILNKIFHLGSRYRRLETEDRKKNLCVPPPEKKIHDIRMWNRSCHSRRGRGPHLSICTQDTNGSGLCPFRQNIASINFTPPFNTYNGVNPDT